MGAFHTLSVEIGRQFSLEKPCWDQIFLDRVDESCHPERDADIAAVVMAANGLAHVCLVTTHLTINKQRIDVTIPKKRSGSSAQSKSTTKFFEQVYQAILRHVDFSKIKCVLIGSPGFVKDDFYKFLQTEATRRSDRPFIENKNKFVLCKASSGHKHALEEVFADQNIMSRLTETKVAKEVGALHRFMRMMDTDPHQAQYGYLLVQKADEQMAIDTLLVTDELFRSTQVETRKKYVKLVESVREHGGAVYLLSTMHVSGVQLQQVSGVAAILRFPLPELADFDDEEEDTDDDSDSSEDPFENSCEPAVDLNDEF
uniref:Eukaryotic peptide chain release factor subunit 1 n=1 Tax=Proboscia inermis TaxID=420281 RepID=A0A7S0CJY0_9STRA|mmetsp:Transcript_53266/g.53695  ORF Transcript_53266/g.53695 Transcript_53266/m.53695 type:complete len:314 (+) Transcript_53266:159-1100(+)|eukprot:CAMPEP_0171319728 /NCGR_PEP_ID=MMETSP0816-20121228/98790_1 /TAXON_ID=420281 /ORGANISM="Proboscia inermis, Strain CCAP1064/1" /LENGTH=313 /DNA_ID=CAMNT_0011815757 /DNA_START=119 /DNA_END=1060 /DNA_ORIENTATION=-